MASNKNAKETREKLKEIDNSNHKPEQDKVEIPKSLFDNDRLWEYVAQLMIHRHDPADILEDWLKENKPDYFND